jgi:hypothetical protein
MITRQTGFVAGAALAIGLVIGAVGSVAAADPSTGPGSGWMMGGSFAPNAGYGPEMMGGSGDGRGMMGGWGYQRMTGNLSDAERQTLLERCDQIHDAMHSAVGGSPAPAASSTPKS